MISELAHSGALPTLERLVQFTEARQGVLAHNIANLSTAGFRPKDLDVDAFRKTLGKAIDKRRNDGHPHFRPLPLSDTNQLTFHASRLDATAEPLDENVMFHDGNNRDLDRLMQDVAENQLAHDFGIAMLRNQFEQLRVAIRENV